MVIKAENFYVVCFGVLLSFPVYFLSTFLFSASLCLRFLQCLLNYSTVLLVFTPLKQFIYNKLGLAVYICSMPELS